MSIHEARDAAWEVRWHWGGRNRSVRENGPYELAKKIERKRMSVCDENRHSDVRHEVNFKKSLDQKKYRVALREINRTSFGLRMIVLIALTTGMRMAEIFGLTWDDLRYSEGLIAVRAKLKGGSNRYVPNDY